MASDEEITDLVKRVTEATLKAVSARDNVSVSFAPGAHGVSQSIDSSHARLPTPSRRCSLEEMRAIRGEADAAALRLRYHDPENFEHQMPAGTSGAELCDAAEQARVEALGSRVLHGVAGNISEYLEVQCRDQGYHLTAERDEKPAHRRRRPRHSRAPDRPTLAALGRPADGQLARLDRRKNWP